jgi:hypothetical protein
LFYVGIENLLTRAARWYVQIVAEDRRISRGEAIRFADETAVTTTCYRYLDVMLIIAEEALGVVIDFLLGGEQTTVVLPQRRYVGCFVQRPALLGFGPAYECEREWLSLPLDRLGPLRRHYLERCETAVLRIVDSDRLVLFSGGLGYTWTAAYCFAEHRLESAESLLSFRTSTVFGVQSWLWTRYEL